ncbi:MAG TPA: DUF3048 domain-containing protein [Acidimicrobiales bacterium]|nr:DUF3048 domain-containing protein [Acidimicrobiales bacterium]
MRRTTVAVVALALITTACGGGDQKLASTTTTIVPQATTSTIPPEAAFLTGVPQPDGKKQDRPALTIKVDNAPLARPQAGLDAADVVFEEVVEGGVVRFLAVFHSKDADVVGPVRSVRPVDPEIVTPIKGLFASSGGAPQFERLIKKAPVTLVGWDDLPKAYTQRKGRPAPHNLFTSTTELYKGAKKAATPPPPLFTFLPTGQPFAVAGGSPLTSLAVQMGGPTKAEWNWDDGVGVWRRVTNGTEHKLDNGQQLGFTNVIIQFVRYVDTGSRDTAGFAVPTAKVIGKGEAWILSDGRLVKAKWDKASAAAITSYTDSSNLPVKLTPGTTWVALAPIGAQTTVR